MLAAPREVATVGWLTLPEGRIWATNYSIHLIWFLKLDNNRINWVSFLKIKILRLHPHRVYFSNTWMGPKESVSFKSPQMGFPGGAVVESLPANAGDTGSSPGLGGSHVPRGGWAREPQLLSLHVWSLCSATREAAMVRGPRSAMKSGPHLPQLEKSPRAETKTQNSHK